MKLQKQGVTNRVLPVNNMFGNLDRLLEEYISKLEQKFVYQANQLQTITDNAASSLFLIDSIGRTMFMNPAAVATTGYVLGEINKRKLHTVLHHAHKPKATGGAPCIILDALQNSHKMKDHEDVFYRKDGSSFQVSVSVSPLLEEGKIQGAVVEFQDISRRKALERQKDDFLGVASHELKTPVTSIKAYAQLLQSRFEKNQDKESAGLIGKMDVQLDKLSFLISDLLDVTKIEGGKMQYHDSFFDINELLSEIIDDVQRTVPTHKIIKRLGQSVHIYADRDRAGQVLTNLLTNGVKYSPASGNIVVTTTHTNNSVEVHVRDKGIGISDDNKLRIFERFYRISGPRENTFPGLGLGLYISAEIVKRHGGRIWVKSTLGKGSTFSFSLPKKRKRIRA